VDIDIAGRTGLVTGASSGIGRGIALALGREGVRLAVHGRRRDRLEQLGDDIVAAGGIRPYLVVCDLTAPDAVETIAHDVAAEFGSVEILVNNAGGGQWLGPNATEVEWDEAMTLNFTRHRQVTALFTPAMVATGYGRVVNITGKSESTKGVNGAHSAKAAMHAWAHGLARDLGRSGVTVNSIAPGKIMSDQILRRYTPEFRAREAEQEIPLGRYGEPADIANLVCYLASPLAGYITGTVIPVDGGLRRYQF